MAAAFLAAGAVAGAAPEKKKQPNIIIILSDDLGWGDIRAYNDTTKLETPVVDRLASEGIRLTNAHTPSAVCTPTRYGLLTGRYPWRTYLKQGVLPGYAPAMITADTPTIPSLLKSKGYRTGGFGKWHVGVDWQGIEGSDNAWMKNWGVRTPGGIAENGRLVDHDKPFANAPTDVGFDTYIGTPSNSGRLPFLIDGNRVVGPLSPNEDGVMSSATVQPDSIDDIHVANTVSFIEHHQKEHAGEPFFVYLALNAIHGVVSVPEELLGSSNYSSREDKIMWVERSVNTVLETLERLDLKDDSLVIFSSDNGPLRFRRSEEKGHRAAGPYRGHKTNLWDGGTRVPLVARWPGHIPAGATTDQLMCLTDVMASLASLLGIELPANAGPDSVDRMALLFGKKADERPALVTHSYRGKYAIRKGRWKAIFGTKWHGGHPSGKYGLERPKGIPEDEPGIGQLYDLVDDPYETNDLWEKRPDIVKDLTCELERIKSLPGAEGRGLPPQAIRKKRSR